MTTPSSGMYDLSMSQDNSKFTLNAPVINPPQEINQFNVTLKKHQQQYNQADTNA